MDLVSESTSLVEQSAKITISSKEDIENAVAFIQSANDFIARIDAEFSESVKKAHELHKMELDRVARFKADPEKVIEIIKGKLRDHFLPMPVKSRETIKVKGLSLRRKLKTEIPSDEKEVMRLMKLVVAGDLPITLFKIDADTYTSLADAKVKGIETKSKPIKVEEILTVVVAKK